MGREIRRVPADWEHPRYTEEDATHRDRIGDYRPLCDQDYRSAAKKWTRDFDRWRAGTHPDQTADRPYFWEWEDPPDPRSYRERRWTKQQATHYQVYETISDGCPVTPAFASMDALVEYLVAQGDFWDQKRGDGGWDRAVAERFVKRGSAMSLVVERTEKRLSILAPRDGA